MRQKILSTLNNFGLQIGTQHVHESQRNTSWNRKKNLDEFLNNSEQWLLLNSKQHKKGQSLHQLLRKRRLLLVSLFEGVRRPTERLIIKKWAWFLVFLWLWNAVTEVEYIRDSAKSRLNLHWGWWDLAGACNFLPSCPHPLNAVSELSQQLGTTGCGVISAVALGFLPLLLAENFLTSDQLHMLPVPLNLNILIRNFLFISGYSCSFKKVLA